MKRDMTFYISVVTLVLVAIVTYKVFKPEWGPGPLRKSQGQFQNPPEHRGPPPEAVTACKDKTEGSECQFIGGRGETVPGTCKSEDVGMACTPKDRPPREGVRDENDPLPPGRDFGQGPLEHRGPPPEAITACQGKTDGNQCQFTGGRGENVAGTCRSEDNGPMACDPKDRPHWPDDSGEGN